MLLLLSDSHWIITLYAQRLTVQWKEHPASGQRQKMCWAPTLLQVESNGSQRRKGQEENHLLTIRNPPMNIPHSCMGAERHVLSSSIPKVHFLGEWMVKGTKKTIQKNLTLKVWFYASFSLQLSKGLFSYNPFFILPFSCHAWMSLDHPS